MNCMERLISSCCHHAWNQFGNVEIPKSLAHNPLYYLIALEPGESLTPIHTGIEEQKMSPAIFKFLNMIVNLHGKFILNSSFLYLRILKNHTFV